MSALRFSDFGDGVVRIERALVIVLKFTDGTVHKANFEFR